MASDALWVVSFKCVVKGYQECRFDVKEGEDFRVLKKIGKKGRNTEIRGNNDSFVQICSFHYRGQFIFVIE